MGVAGGEGVSRGGSDWVGGARGEDGWGDGVRDGGCCGGSDWAGAEGGEVGSRGGSDWVGGEEG